MSDNNSFRCAHCGKVISQWEGYRAAGHWLPRLYHDACWWQVFRPGQSRSVGFRNRGVTRGE